MPTFALINGGFCRGWVWAETAAALHEDGHQVEVIDLPSSGTEAAELGDLQADIAAVRRTLDGIGAEILLVGHSVAEWCSPNSPITRRCDTACTWPRSGPQGAIGRRYASGPCREEYPKMAFAKGTVYFRHGAKSEPATTADLLLSAYLSGHGSMINGNALS